MGLVTPWLLAVPDRWLGLPSRDLALGYGVTGYDSETCWHDYRLGGCRHH